MKKALPESRVATAEWPIRFGSKAMRPRARKPAPRPNISRAAAKTRIANRSVKTESAMRARKSHPALMHLLSQRLGRTVLLTNRLDWTAEQVVSGYAGQQQIERVFRGLKDGEWLGWGPMYHWTDSKIRIHAFYCMLGISLLQYLHRESRNVWPGLSVERFLEELRQIQQFVLLYPPLGDKGPNRVAVMGHDLPPLHSHDILRCVRHIAL